MSTHVEKRPGPLARALEGIGYGAGCAAGSVALLLLWTFDVTSRMQGAVWPSGGSGEA